MKISGFLMVLLFLRLIKTIVTISLKYGCFEMKKKNNPLSEQFENLTEKKEETEENRYT